jgi:trigger factor
VKTSVTELPDSRVRVDVDVDADDVEAKVRDAAKELARDMKAPGFRKGKVPPEMVLQRVGREGVLQEALQHSLAEWYERAVLDAGISPVGDPQLKLDDLPDEGQPLSFSIEIGVRPAAELGEYKGLEVGKAEPEVPADAVEGELDRLRQGFASLQPVERAAADGDLLLVDYTGKVDGEPFEGGEARDHMVELGAGTLLEPFEEGLKGASAGDDREVEVTFPDDYRPESLAGKTAKFEVKVKEVREKKLPELDDDFASQSSEFETLDELKEEIEGRIRHALEHRSEDQFRQAALDAAVEKAKVDIPDEIVTARARESWERASRQLAAQGLDPASYLKMQGKTEDELVESAKPDAEQSLKREAVLSAVIEAENIEVTEEEMLEALRPAAEQEGSEPQAVLDRVRSRGRDAVLREDLQLRKALDAIAESAKPIPLEAAEAREKLWTPDKEHEGKGALWTPGDPE